jgi:hypothetical protein
LKLALSAAQLKRKKIYTIHTSSQLQKKHHTGTEVMATKKKLKAFILNCSATHCNEKYAKISRQYIFQTVKEYKNRTCYHLEGETGGIVLKCECCS